MQQNFSKKMIAQAHTKAMKKSSALRLSTLSNNEVAKEIKKSSDPFLSSQEWKALRKKVIETYGAKCMKCKVIPKGRGQINVDHIKPRIYYPHLALDFDNLQVLCCSCNKAKGNKNSIDYR